MNSSDSKRLQQKHEESLAICRNNIALWGKHKNDYESLHERIRTLPDKTSHDMMVPLGPLALVPGKVVHTNEVFVLLGDNWFAERSCKQACDILERRIKHCDLMLDKFHEEEQNIKNWLEYSEDIRAETNDFVEIVEEFDEEKEMLWREKHRKNVQKYHKQLAEVKNQLQNMSTQSCLPEATIQEECPVESNFASTSSTGGYGDTEINVYRNKGRRVSWQDQSDVSSKQLTQDDDVEESENDDEDDSSPLTIYFTHSDSIHCQSDDDRNADDTSFTGEVTSPAHIYIKYGHFMQKTPKSILKKRESNTRGVDAETQPSIQIPCETIKDANSECEPKKSSSVILSSVVEHTATDQPSCSNVHRPTSRFKAQRQSAQKKT
uniref:Unconventional prefoldin RPB5 interactor n=1 Tax=Strigamia maritima TaxID=126957 RepID=T1J296_STRMM